MEMSQARSTSGLLYPMMVIAAIAVIVFSIVGIASITGWMPRAMVGNATTVAAQTIDSTLATEPASAGAAFQCAECGFIETVREIERRGSLFSAPVAAVGEPAQPATTGL